MAKPVADPNVKIFKPYNLGLPTSLTLELHPDKIVFKSGIFGKDERYIPYKTITDVSIRKGCLGAASGIGALVIQTAGSDRAELVLPNLRKIDEARDIILERMKQN